MCIMVLTNGLSVGNLVLHLVSIGKLVGRLGRIFAAVQRHAGTPFALRSVYSQLVFDEVCMQLERLCKRILSS